MSRTTPTRSNKTTFCALALCALIAGACVPEGPRNEEGFIPTPDGPAWVTYRIEGTRAIYQGDIVFELEALRAYQAEHVDDMHPVTPKSYEMLNGDGRLDTSYEGTGAVATPLAPLSGGLGKLSDKRKPTDANFQESVVSWSTVDPVVTFRFGQVVDLSAVRLYFHTGAGAGFPARIELRMGGETFTYDPPAANPGDSLVLVTNALGGGLGFSGRNLEITLVRGASALELGEVELVTGNLFVTQAAVSGKRWGSTVSYQIGSSIESREAEIRDALDDWEDASDFTFVESPSADPRIRFEAASSGCVTFGLGRPDSSIPFADGVRKIELASSCGIGTIRHEIGHALGLEHEQKRSDRDEYVRYHKQHVLPDKRDQFEIGGKLFGEYNFASLMHYGSTAFSRNACCSTPVSVSGSVLPSECRYFDEVSVPASGGGRMCPADRPNFTATPSLVPRVDLPNLVTGSTVSIGQRDFISKGDSAAANAMVAGTGDEFAARSYNSLSELAVAGSEFDRPPKRFQVGDVNGDGRDDLVAFYQGTQSGIDGDVDVALGQASGGFGPVQNWDNWFCTGSEKCRLGDVDGDGDEDAVSFATNGVVEVATSDGRGFWNPTPWSNNMGWAAHFALADMDGDCREDAVAFRWSSTGHYYDVDVAVSRPGGFATPVRWGRIYATLPTVGDVQGDGKADLVALNSSGSVVVYPSTGTDFGAEQNWAPFFCSGGACDELEIRRVDADKRGDLVVFSPSATHHLDRVQVVRSSGWAFATELRRYHEIDCRGPHCAASDVDGDGELDVVDPITSLDPELPNEGRLRGDAYVSHGTQIWMDPIGSVKPILTLQQCELSVNR